MQNQTNTTNVRLHLNRVTTLPCALNDRRALKRTPITARKSDQNINCSIRLVNEGFKSHSDRKKTMSELKAVLEMTTTCPDTS